AVGLLVRDYLGLARFWDLERQGLAKGPLVASSKTPFKAGLKEMLWDENHYQIKEPGRFIEKNEARPKAQKGPQRD
ncbi:MAG: hypothetical protein LBE01_05475, partial [Deltaproteobacteria bacterium]|nr:hypothetical protein [Deltaproteobacteria bacterium]